jgi:uncharacterized membrane protein YqhA
MRPAGHGSAKNSNAFEKKKVAVLAIAVVRIAMFKFTIPKSDAENEIKMAMVQEAMLVICSAMSGGVSGALAVRAVLKILAC